MRHVLCIMGAISCNQIQCFFSKMCLFTVKCEYYKCPRVNSGWAHHQATCTRLIFLNASFSELLRFEILCEGLWTLFSHVPSQLSLPFSCVALCPCSEADKPRDHHCFWPLLQSSFPCRTCCLFPLLSCFLFIYLFFATPRSIWEFEFPD